MSHRMILGFPLASAITVGLFLLMQSLIQVEFAPPVEPLPDQDIDFLRKPIIEEPTLDVDPPDRPVQRDPPPTPPRVVPKPNPDGPVIDVTVPTFDLPKGDAGPIHRTAMSVLRIPPTYPESVATKGIEGWVLVEFDITPSGTVQNANVVDAEPARIFDRSALKAIKRWKYRSKLVNGEPVFQYGIQQKITYELEGEE